MKSINNLLRKFSVCPTFINQDGNEELQKHQSAVETLQVVARTIYLKTLYLKGTSYKIKLRKNSNCKHEKYTQSYFSNRKFRVCQIQ